MLSLTSTQLHQSKTDGVSFITRRIGPALRARASLEIASARAKLDVSIREQEPLQKELNALLDASEKDEKGIPLATKDGSKATPEMWDVSSKLTKIREKMADMSRAEIAPVWFRYALVSVDGIEFDGHPITPAQMAESGPDDVFEEIFSHLADEFNLPEVQVKNSQSPTTSQPPADGTATNETSGNASDASSQTSTSEETVTPSSRSMQKAA